MRILELFAALLLAALPIAAAVWLARRMHRRRAISVYWVAGLIVAGIVLGGAAVWMERAVLQATGLSVEALPGNASMALLAMLLLVVPLEELLKLAGVGPAYLARRVDSPGTGLLFACCVAAGFAACEAVAYLGGRDMGLRALRAAAGVPAHLFSAGLWGYALGMRARSGRRWVAAAWGGAVVIRGIYDHVVFGRGPGVLAIAAPMLAGMALLTWSALREVAPDHERGSSTLLPEPPSLRELRRALRRRGSPLMLRWIAIAALVNVGVLLAALAFAVYLGHRLGIDFAAADEADMRSNGPLVLLGTAALGAFPFAAYLVARASGTVSVLEPALGAALAIAAVLAMLSVTAPIAVLFGVAVAPVAFGLACGGAWFGVGR